MLKRFSLILVVCLFCFSIGAQWLIAEEDAESEKEVKSATEEVKKKEDKPAAVEVKKKSKTKDTAAGFNEDHSRETGGIEIDNHGIQAIFINSEVTIHGGTIGGEIHKTVNQQAKEEEEEEGNGERQPSRPSGGGGKPDEPGKFAKAIKDATKIEGLFTLYEKEDNQLLMEIKPEQMKQDYLISGAYATGVGQGWVKPGFDIGSLIVGFKKINNKIHFIQRNKRFIVSDDDQKMEAVRKNHGESLFAAIPVAATNPENEAYLLDVTKLFISDPFEISNEVRGSLGAPFGIDSSGSYIEQAKGFPQNIVIRTHYAFRSGSSANAITFPDGRNIQVETIVDVRPMKENPNFKARPADRRVGYFVEALYDFGNVERNENFIKYISRWDVKKASPEEELSPPKKPIVMWLENTIPEKWRKPVREGVLEWNKAFEKIGIKDAIVVKDQPEDAEWDAADARYNTIHWNTSYEEIYGGVAQWVAHPQTGEILNGGFLLEGDQIRSVLNIEEYRQPDEADELKRFFEAELPKGANHFGCDYSRKLVEQAKVGLTILAAREGIENVTEGMKRDFVEQFLFAISAHEMGHVLGLRHNFKASTHLPLKDIHNKKITSDKSITASVMEYAPINIAPPGEEQGYYFEPTIGAYDYFAIEYGYKDIKPATDETEVDILNNIAEQGETGDLIYATDEELYAYGGVDPLNNHFDLGNDPLAWGEYMTHSISETIPLLPNLVQEGEDYHIVRSSFNRLLNYFYSNARYAVYYLGGQHTYRLKKGGNNDLLPLDPVDPKKQREALNFLIERTFGDDLFDFKPELLNMLRGERDYHWGTPFPGESIAYSVTDMAEAIYDTLLYYLYAPRVMRSILDTENQRQPSAEQFTLPEFFDTLNEGIWSEVYSLADSENNSNRQYSNDDPFLSVYRRTLQRLHLKLLIRIMLEPPIGMPDDARTQAWRMLTDLEDKIEDALDEMDDFEKADEYSRTHLAESLEKIERSLEARVNVRVDLW